VDWYGEAAEIAKHADLGRTALEQSNCDATRRPHSLLPKCKKHQELQLEPEPKRAGFDRGVAYVRLGKRCVAGIGILVAGFGCAVGKLPPEGSGGTAMYKDMHDPNRPRSSVPDIPDTIAADELDSNTGPRLRGMQK